MKKENKQIAHAQVSSAQQRFVTSGDSDAKLL